MSLEEIRKHRDEKKVERDILAIKDCPMDGGGYFIIGGHEKVIVSQVRNRRILYKCLSHKKQS